MIRKIKIVLILITLVSYVNAKSEIASGNICTPRTPIINHDDAIKLAIDKASSVIPTKESFIDQVTLTCVENKYIWTIGFRRKSYESGHLVVNLSMDTTIKVTVIKDG